MRVYYSCNDGSHRGCFFLDRCNSYIRSWMLLVLLLVGSSFIKPSSGFLCFVPIQQQQQIQRHTNENNGNALMIDNQRNNEKFHRRQQRFFLTKQNALNMISISSSSSSSSSQATTSRMGRRDMSLSAAAAAKGFGSSSSSSPSKKKKQQQQQQAKKPNKKTIMKQLEETYGGTTPQDIARGTQQRMDESRQQLSPQVQLALRLYQQLQQWKYRLSTMSVLQQANIPQQDMDGAQRAQAELDKLLSEISNESDGDVTVTENDLHNLLQQMTWDASADAKAARSVTGSMPDKIQEHVTEACSIVSKAVTTSGTTRTGRCLDVGCGFGVLVPFLTKAGVDADQIYGIDLSSEMIKNAELFYPGPTYQAVDFFQYQPTEAELSKKAKKKNGSTTTTTTTTEETDGQMGYFDAIVFCASLHDMPNMMGAMNKAVSLLRPPSSSHGDVNDGGVLVIAHPQGANHVLQQVRSNPVLVQRGLPTREELISFCDEFNANKNDQDTSSTTLKLVQEPIDASPMTSTITTTPGRKIDNTSEGYLAVLQKT